MADARLFRLRRHLNGMQRLTVQRAYTLDTQKTSHTPEEQAAFLRAADQSALLETHSQIDNLVSHVNKVNEHLSNLPTTIQGPAIWDPTNEAKIQARELKRHPRHIPPYTLGWLRNRIADTPDIVEKVINRANHVKDHLTDLQYEPYADERGGSSSSTAAWQTEIARMTQEERETALKNLQLEEEAASHRLKRDSESLMRKVNEIRVGGEKSGGMVDLDAPEKAANPFLTADGRKRVNVAAAPVAHRDGDGKSTERAVTPPPTQSEPPRLNLADLQRQLEVQLTNKSKKS